MKALSPFLLLLSSTDFRIASGAEVRAGPGVEDETLQERSSHDLAEADEHPTASADIAKDHDHLFVKQMAEEYDLSMEEAKEVREVHSDFEELVEDLFDDVNFLQSEMPTELNGPFILKFKNGKVPEQGQDGIKQFREKNKNAKLEIVHSRLSLEEAEERGDRFLATLESKGHPRVTYAIDGDDLEVWAAKPKGRRSLGEAEGGDDGLMSSSRTAEILDLDQDHHDLEGVELRLYEHRDKGPANAHQGIRGLANARQGEDAADSTLARPDARRLDFDQAMGGTKLDGPVGDCTGGFVVRKKRSPKKCGIVTAGHCHSLRKMDTNEWGGEQFDLKHQAWSIDKYGEYHWYSFDKKHRAANLVITERNDRHVVQRTARGISKGQLICGYSREHKETLCMNVRNTSGSDSWREPVYEEMGIKSVSFKKVVVMQQPEVWKGCALNYYWMRDGDSGGPWWSSRASAQGVTGGDWPKCEESGHGLCLFFSRVKYIEDKLGIKVVTEFDPDCE